MNRSWVEGCTWWLKLLSHPTPKHIDHLALCQLGLGIKHETTNQTTNQIQIFDLGNIIKPDPRSCSLEEEAGARAAPLSRTPVRKTQIECFSNKMRMVWTRNIHRHAKTGLHGRSCSCIFLSFLDLYLLGSVSCSNLYRPHLPGHYRSLGTWTCPNTEKSPLKVVVPSELIVPHIGWIYGINLYKSI